MQPKTFRRRGLQENPHSWKLPYLLADGVVDAKILPKAVQAILSNYRARRFRASLKDRRRKRPAG